VTSWKSSKDADVSDCSSYNACLLLLFWTCYYLQTEQ
jgi:hypothetical protein